VPADVREARWETTIQVHERDGAPAFRGPAVNGPPRERFLYLTWIGRKGGAAPAMFRRAKLRWTRSRLRIDRVVALGRPRRSARAHRRRTACRLCASVRPPRPLVDELVSARQRPIDSSRAVVRPQRRSTPRSAPCA
jgi:hypothetical protein